MSYPTSHLTIIIINCVDAAMTTTGIMVARAMDQINSCKHIRFQCSVLVGEGVIILQMLTMYTLNVSYRR